MAGKSPKFRERSGNLCSRGNLIVAAQQKHLRVLLLLRMRATMYFITLKITCDNYFAQRQTGLLLQTETSGQSTRQVSPSDRQRGRTEAALGKPTVGKTVVCVH